MSNYTVTHIHTMLSNGVTNIDSVTRFQDYIEVARSYGMTAMAFTEHGSVFEWFHKKEALEAAGMKYIHAAEVYLTESLDEKIRDNYHCCLYAKNYDGVRELNRMISKSFNRQDNHFYYTPRISFDELFQTSDNILVTSACIGGALYKGTDSAKAKFLNFCLRNKHRCFLEVQPHLVAEQVSHNRYLYDISRQYGIRLIAGTDTHALNDAHIKGRSILQRAKNVFFEGEDGWELRFLSYEQLCDLFRRQGALPREAYLEAIENTNVLTSMIEPFILDHGTKYPHIYDNPEQKFRELIDECAKNHPYIHQRHSEDTIRSTLEQEIEVYERTGAIDFMLLQKYLRDWEHENGIYCGPGRGSVSGSFVAYVLGITEMDSIRFGLNFFRFMNPDRVTNADIDTDYGGEDRDKVKYFLLHDKMNLPQIQSAEIITFNTIAAKGAVRDVCRALYKDTEKDYLAIASYICEHIDTQEGKMRKEYPEVFEYVDIVSGVIVSIGSHPSGVLVSDREIAEDIGLCSTSGSDYMISMLNMKELDALMYVKLDILGLDNMAVINDTCKLAGIDRATPDNTPLDDMDVWRSIRDDTTLIFQFESASAQAYLRRLFSDATLEIARKRNPNFSMIKWLSFGNGLIRPSCASFRDDIAKGIAVTNGMKELDDFLADTLGHISMQEDIMQFLVKFCGYSPAESDNVRRCVDGDTLITMADSSLKKIKDLNPGEKVATFDGEFATISNVNHVFDNGVASCIKINTEHQNELVCTKDHKVLTQDGWKKAGDLTIDDYIMVPTKLYNTPDGRKPQKRLSATDTFLIGLLIGDGTLGSQDLVFTNSDEQIIEKYKECVSNRAGVHGECKFNIKSVPGKTVDQIYSVRIVTSSYKNSIMRMLKIRGLNVKSAEKHIPSDIMSYPVGEKLSNFIAALFTTDGGYCKNVLAIEYSTISYQLAYELKSLLLKYNIYSYVMKKKVSGYNYYSYSLRILGRKSFEQFDKYIIPYIVGYKKQLYRETIEASYTNKNSYDYLIPPVCLKEIFENSLRSRTSIRSISTDEEFSIHRNLQTTLSNVKAEKAVRHIYAPKTYRLLMSDYMPRKVKEITEVGDRHVYDIEVEDTHNYIANGLIVHNCIAKKYGTESVLPEIRRRFIEYSMDTFHYPESLCEQVIEPFLQVILDASSYGFSWNHSDAYSCIGYICGYLRYHYPLEFVAAALNVFHDKEEKTAAIIDYAVRHNISLSPAKFGKSRSGYMIDKKNQVIYKGMESIKFLNTACSEFLYSLRDKPYLTFIDLLYDLSDSTAINTRQIDVLIKIDFFSQFGNITELSRIVSLFDLFKQGQAKSISREKIDGTWIEPLIQPYVESIGKNGKPLKSYRILQAREALNTCARYLLDQNLPDISYRLKIQNQQDYLGYVDLTTNRDEDRRKLFVMDVRPMVSKTGRSVGSVWGYAVFTRSIGSGKQLRFTIKTDLFSATPVSKGEVIYADKAYVNKSGYYYLDAYHHIDG